MTYLITFLVFGLLLTGMAAGLIFAKKTLKRGCTMDPDDCACRREGKDPSECEN